MSKVEVFDQTVLEPEVGIRALWLLYKRGAWGYLEDFGLERREAEPLLRKFEIGHVITADRLTASQCKRLVRVVPGVGAAAKELQLAYAFRFVGDALKFIDGEKDAGLDSGGTR